MKRSNGLLFQEKIDEKISNFQIIQYGIDLNKFQITSTNDQ